MLSLSSEIWVPIQLTLELAAITTLSLLVVATPLAWWLARSRARWKEAVAAIVSLPMVLPPTVLGFYLLILLGPDGPGGAIASLWGARTLAFTFTGLVIGSIVSSITIIRDSSAIARADHEPAHIGLTPLRATAPASDDHLALPSRLLRLDYRNTPSPELVQSSSNDFIQAKNGGGEIRTLGTPIRRTTVFETLKNPL